MTLFIRGVEKLLRRAAPVSERLAQIETPVMVELGVDIGKLSNLLLERHQSLTLYAIDNWRSHEHQPPAYIATRDGHAMVSKAQADGRKAMAISQLRRFGRRVVIHEGDSVESAKLFVDGTIDLVFVDADHSYPAVLADIEAWWPKVRPGGWLGGDDYDHPDPRFNFGVKEAVDRWINATGHTLVLDGDDSYTKTWWVHKSSSEAMINAPS